MLNSRTSWLIHPPCPSWRVLLVNTAFLSLDGHCHVLKGTLLDGSPPTQQWSPGEGQAHRRMLLNQGCDVFSWSMLDQGHIPLGSTGPWIFWAKRGKSTYTQSYWLGQARMGEISLVFVCKPTKWGTTECSRWDATPKIDRRKHVGELISFLSLPAASLRSDHQVHVWGWNFVICSYEQTHVDMEEGSQLPFHPSERTLPYK